MDGFRPVRVYFWAVLSLVLFGLALMVWVLILAAGNPPNASLESTNSLTSFNQTPTRRAVAQPNPVAVNVHAQQSFIEIDQNSPNLDIITDGSLVGWQYFIRTTEPGCDGQADSGWISLDVLPATISLSLPIASPNISNWYCLRAQTTDGNYIYSKYHYQPSIGDLVIAGDQVPASLVVGSRPSIWSLLIVIAATTSLTFSLRKP